MVLVRLRNNTEKNYYYFYCSHYARYGMLVFIKTTAKATDTKWTIREWAKKSFHVDKQICFLQASSTCFNKFKLHVSISSSKKCLLCLLWIEGGVVGETTRTIWGFNEGGLLFCSNVWQMRRFESFTFSLLFTAINISLIFLYANVVNLKQKSSFYVTWRWIA